MVLLFYRRFSEKTYVPIAVLSEYAEKEYEPFDSYSRFLPAMPVAACFSNTALCTPGKLAVAFFSVIELHMDLLSMGIGVEFDGTDMFGDSE